MLSVGKMKSAARDALGSVARDMLLAVPLAVWRRLFPKDALGLCYHMVSDAKLPHLKHYPFLSPAEFEADIVYLQKTFGFVSYEELVRRRSSANAVRDNSAILTFDDGFSECASVAAPILRRRGVPGIFFVITDLIDNKVVFRESAASLCIDAVLRLPVPQVEAIVQELGLDAILQPPPEKAASGSAWSPLDVAVFGSEPDARLRPLLYWLLTISPVQAERLEALCARLGVDPKAYLERVQPYLTTQQIRQLRADGFTIGAHSCSHRMLQTLPGHEAEREIVESCRLLRDLTGQRNVPFAFPYIGRGIDRGWLAQLRARHDFIGLFFDSDGLRADKPFVVQRAFCERVGRDRTLDAILRRAWARPRAWRR
jgi:peptidoglycan/xylan/chitin deacetylase (PgdA/CDA1 family)